MILQQVENDVTAPADPARIQQVVIYRSDQNGAVFGGQQNVYTRTGSTTCTLSDGTVLDRSLHRPVGRHATPPHARCNILVGLPGAACGPDEVDTIGVKVIYKHSWVTPLANLVSLDGTGATLVQSNAMRMEPVL